MKKLVFLPAALLATWPMAALPVADTVTAIHPTAARHPENVYTRMFPDLPPFSQQTNDARKAVQQLGAKDGLLDAHDQLTDPVASITRPGPVNQDNPTMTAGMTFLGQFLDHDITFDKKSALNANVSPLQTINFRTAAFDLDSVYGDGPQASPQLYETRNGRIKFILQRIPGAETVSRHNAIRYDVPRDAKANAIVAESRNDENAVISQMQVAFLSFHNAVTDWLAAQPAYKGASADRIFQDARRLVTWHYQWIILHEFLPRTIGAGLLAKILRDGPQFYRPQDPVNRFQAVNGDSMPRIPIEFAAAAYRFGHSQIRPSYRLNFGATGGAPLFLLSSTTRRIRLLPTRTTCAAASARRAASSTGKPSLILATVIFATTSGSTPICRRS
jgi:hypothetical protein